MENRNLLRKIRDLLPLLFVVLAAIVARVLPHPPNFAPITGIALFSGSYFGGISAFILPLGIMLASDMVIGFHSTMIYVYGSFLFIVLLGKFLRTKTSFLRLTLTSFVSSILFFTVTNFGVWQRDGIYPKTLPGLEQSYVMAIPFFRNTLLGDFFYTFTLFYGFQLVTLLMNRLVFVKKSS
jgi:hypothetical protein